MASRNSLRNTPNFGRLGGSQTSRQWVPPSNLQPVPDIPDFLHIDIGSRVPATADLEQQADEQPYQQQDLHDKLKDMMYDREKLELELQRERRRMEMMKTDYEVKINRLEEKIGRKIGKASSSSPQPRLPRAMPHPDSPNRLWLGEAARAAHAAVPPSSASSPRTSLSRTTASQPNSSSTVLPADVARVQRSITSGEAQELAELRERVQRFETNQAAQLESLKQQMFVWRREMTDLLEHKLNPQASRGLDGDQMDLQSSLYRATTSPPATTRSSRSSRRSPHRQRSPHRNRSESPMPSDPYRSSRPAMRSNPQVQQDLHSSSAVSSLRPTGTRLMTSSLTVGSAVSPLQVQMPVAVAASGMTASVNVASPQIHPSWQPAGPNAAVAAQIEGMAAPVMGPSPSGTRLARTVGSCSSLPQAASTAASNGIAGSYAYGEYAAMPRPASPPPSSPGSQIREVGMQRGRNSAVASIPPLSRGYPQAKLAQSGGTGAPGLSMRWPPINMSNV
eukprot:gnl/MRDRNA2_/MRDRNA2_76038_c0_seq1.p1 gnl/MRDRNA2_/MRDRNA2_76038_c0~~gnl/MRDRNA2_/MRDRNA2_76038_c0_seq1.p1  ORF type:complete len:506 (-),score=89.26 gnl/MRDRNA2_/MRDRNA2_76038_c0_seq1:6-1523(-)